MFQARRNSQMVEEDSSSSSSSSSSDGESYSYSSGSSGSSSSGEDEAVFGEVEKLVAVRTRIGKGREFLVKWLGYPDEENTWEPENNLPEGMAASFFEQNRENQQNLSDIVVGEDGGSSASESASSGSDEFMDASPKKKTGKKAVAARKVLGEEDNDASDFPGDDDDGLDGAENRVKEGLQRVDRSFERQDRKKQTRSDGQSGVLKRVELINFMNHAHLEHHFQPHINTISGPNGSGKSAVLTALAVVLGARTTFTGRGTGKGLVMDGRASARITVTLTNEGQDAFRSDELGSSFMVERTIKAQGGGDWKLKNAQSKRIVGKNFKRDIQPMLDHFNFQAENPCVLLMQDTAKEFLVNSTPEQKYEFFMKSSQLHDIKERIKEAAINVKDAKKILVVKKAQLPAMEAEVRQIKAEHEARQELTNIKWKFQTTERRASWRLIMDDEDAIEKLEDGRDDAKARLAEAEEQLATAREHHEEAARRLTAVQEDAQAQLERQEAKKEEREKVEQEIKNMTSRGKEARARVTEAKRAWDARKKTLDRIELKLADQRRETAKNAAKISKSSVESNKRKWEDMNDAKIRLKRYKDGEDAAEEEERTTKIDLQNAMQKAKQAQHEVTQYYGKLSSIRERAKESGSSEPTIREFKKPDQTLYLAVQQQRGNFRKAPIGPIGLHLCLKQGFGKWANLIEHKVLKTFMRAYIVDNREDQIMLERLLRQIRVEVPIFVTRFEVPDYIVRTDPDHDLDQRPRVMDAIKLVASCHDTAVFRMLIDHGKADGTVLLEKRAEAENLLTKPAVSKIPSAYTFDNWNVEMKGGNPVASGLGRQSQAIHLREEGVDMSAEVERLEAMKSYYDDMLQKGQVAQAEAERAYRRAQSTNISLKRSITKAEEDIEELEEVLDDADDFDKFETFTQAFAIQEDLEPDMVQKALEIASQLPDAGETVNSLNVLADTMKNLASAQRAVVQAEKDYTKAQRESNASIEAELAPLQKKRDAIFAEIQKMEGENREGELAKLDMQTARTEGKVKVAEKKVGDLRSEVNAKEAELNQLRSKLEKDEKKVFDRFGVRPTEEEQGTETSKQLLREVKGMRDRIKEAVAQQANARDPEIVAEEHHRKTKKLKMMVAHLDQLKRDHKLFQLAIKKRWSNFKDLLFSLENRTEDLFLYYLDQRGYKGEIAFDHLDEKISIKVSIREQANGQTQLSETNTLSGGEKSFTTVALLLALWDPMDIPLRAMDEFDVFMDTINRANALKALVSQARESVARNGYGQFLFISPNSFDASLLGKEMEVCQKFRKNFIHSVRMCPPEVGNRTIDQQLHLN